MSNGKEKIARRIKFLEKRPFLESRARINRSIRSIFHELGFTEVQTPALQVSPGLEPHLQAFATELKDPQGGSARRYLHTSPEFAMKKLLACGMDKIFQLAQVYRNRERSHTHHPEFTMLEWYRAGESYTVLMDDCELLLRACKRAAGGEPIFTWKGVKSDPSLPFERLSVVEAFARYAEADLFASIDHALQPSPQGLREVCGKLGVYFVESDSWEDLFFRIFLEKIEPNLGIGRPTILYDYPISMAALARPKQSDPRLAERFEVYVCGLELANAFGELTDAAEQRRRFEADMEKKQRLYGERYPIDEDFLGALADGFPECSGIALGVDRLAMLAPGANQIEVVLGVRVAQP